jgi:hypothetical protein
MCTARLASSELTGKSIFYFFLSSNKLSFQGENLVLAPFSAKATQLAGLRCNEATSESIGAESLSEWIEYDADKRLGAYVRLFPYCPSVCPNPRPGSNLRDR